MYHHILASVRERLISPNCEIRQVSLQAVRSGRNPRTDNKLEIRYFHTQAFIKTYPLPCYINFYLQTKRRFLTEESSLSPWTRSFSSQVLISTANLQHKGKQLFSADEFQVFGWDGQWGLLVGAWNGTTWELRYQSRASWPCNCVTHNI